MKNKIYIFVILLMFLIGLLYFLTHLEVPTLRLDSSARKFDAKLWGTTPKEDGIREEMFDDLKKNYMPLGMHKNEVVRLLGKSDINGTHNFTFSENQLGYLVSIGLEPCFLVLTFDEQKTLIDRRIECH